jgi:hypothetical protein
MCGGNSFGLCGIVLQVDWVYVLAVVVDWICRFVCVYVCAVCCVCMCVRCVLCAVWYGLAGLDVSDPEPTAYEVAFQAQALTDTSNNVLFTLGQLAKEFPELLPTLRASLEVGAARRRCTGVDVVCSGHEESALRRVPCTFVLCSVCVADVRPCTEDFLLLCWPHGWLPVPLFVLVQTSGLRMPVRPPSRVPTA